MIGCYPIRLGSNPSGEACVLHLNVKVVVKQKWLLTASQWE